MVQSNHSALGEGLRLYTSAMSRFVKQRLETAFGGAWWERGVIKACASGRRQQLESNMAQNPRANISTFLEPGTFVDIVISNYSLFRSTFPKRREVWSLLIQVSEGRNKWAHCLGSSDLTKEDVALTLVAMEKLLSYARLWETGEVEKLRMQVMRMPEPSPPISVAPQPQPPGSRPEPKVHNVEPQRRPQGTLAEVVRQEVIEHWFTPARSRGEREVTVAARDVNKWLGWSQRYPSICSALSDRNGELSRRANVELIQSTRPNPSSTTTFVYRLL